MAHRDAPRSLADADRARRRSRRSRRPRWPLAAGAAAVALGVLGYAALSVASSEQSGPSPLAEPPLVRADGKAVRLGEPVVVVPSGDETAAAPAPAKMRRVRVDVLVDGWSARTLQDLHLRWAPTGASEYQPVALTPVTDADVAELLKTTPGAIEAALARQVSGDSQIDCKPSGCTVGGTEFDLGVLTDPGKVTGLGESYDGWGVNALLYRAALTVPADVTAAVLRADGFYDESLPALPTATRDAAPSAGNGYLRNRYLVGAGLGAFFALEPAWLDGKDGAGRWKTNAPVGIDRAAAKAVTDAPPTIAATAGLATRWDPAQHLTSSHLTYLTSPVTGCGVGVLCVPDRVQATIESRSQDAAVVCQPGGKGTANVVVLDSVRLSAPLKAPVHQFGVYAGKDPKSFDGHTGRGVNGGGVPPLVEDTVKLRWAVAALVDTPDAVVRTMAGRTDAPGAGSMEERVTVGDVVGNVKFDGVQWGTCG